MKIYTKRGDKGQTDLFSGERVSKTNPLIEAYGTVDELNSLLGVIRSRSDEEWKITALLKTIQNQLHTICASLANASEDRKTAEVQPEHISDLEEQCDYFADQVPTLRHFILPGGSEVAGYLHLARSVCRRAERRTIAAAADFPVNEEIIRYLNRLSDLLFLLARFKNHELGYPEEKPDYS